MKRSLFLVFCISALTIPATNLTKMGTTAGQTRQCGTQRGCYDDDALGFPPCLPSPTTLPALQILANSCDTLGFRAETSSCGAKRCFYLFACECGPPLGASVCPPSPRGCR